VASGLDRPLDLTAPPNDGRLFVAEQTGAVRVIAGGVLLPTPFLDVRDSVSCCGERGLLGLAFHPAYPADGRVFVSYTSRSGASRIASFHVSSDSNVADPTETVMLEVPQFASNHNGGQIGFGPDGYLYIGLGDGGGSGDPAQTGQDRTDLLGSMLRIDVDGAAPYAVPATNPYVGHQSFPAEIWNYGLRNPWRFSFDRQTGDLYIADVGQGQREEVNVQPSGSAGGGNYGWNTMEGSICFQSSSCSRAGLILPVVDYDHGNGACSVTGGYVYRGSTIPELAGTYFYGDYCAGWVRSFRYANGQAMEHTTWASLETGGGLASFGQDAAGELYIISGSTVARIVRGS
jgi:glucose/arabinose dehydrogenase